MTKTAAERLIPELQGFFDAVEREDIEALEVVLDRNVHPDSEFTSQIGSELEGRTFLGPDGIREWFTDLIATMKLRYEDREFRTVGENAVLFLTTFSGKGRGSGADVSREIGVIWELEDGLVRRTISCPTQSEALAAAEALLA